MFPGSNELATWEAFSLFLACLSLAATLWGLDPETLTSTASVYKLGARFCVRHRLHPRASHGALVINQTVCGVQRGRQSEPAGVIVSDTLQDTPSELA